VFRSSIDDKALDRHFANARPLRLQGNVREFPLVEKSTGAHAGSLSGSRDRWYLPIGIALIAVGIVLMGRKIHLDATWPAGTDISVYLSAVKNVAAGLHPYGDVHAHPFAYPPLFAELISLLFPVFSDGKWWAIWSALTFVQLIAALIIMMRGFGEKLPWGAVALVCGVISVSHLTRSEVFHGQADFTILLLLVLGLRFSTLQKPLATAVAWSIMMNIKPFLGIVVIHQLVTRRYREAIYTLIAGGTIFALSFAAFGSDAIDAFLKWRASAAWYTSVPEIARFDNQSFYEFFARICNATEYGVPLANCQSAVPFLMLPVLAAAAVALFLIARSIMMLSRENRLTPVHEMLAAGVVIAAVMSCGPTYYGDYVYLLLPGAFGAYLLASGGHDRTGWLVVTAIWCVALYSLALPFSIRLTDTYRWSQLYGIRHLAGIQNGTVAMVCALVSSAFLYRSASRQTRGTGSGALGEMGQRAG
jgi:hypothetical protein